MDGMTVSPHLSRAVDLAVGILLLLIVGTTLAATGNRYLFGGAWPWSEDLNLLMWVWMIQLAALRAAHIRITYFVDRIPPQCAAVAAMIVAALSIVVLGVLTYGALRMAVFTRNDIYVSIPWLPESAKFLPIILVGPVWALLQAHAALGVRGRD